MKKAFVAERSCRGKNANGFWRELAKLGQVHGCSLDRSVSVRPSAQVLSKALPARELLG